ncbi:MAG TPA: helix-turn-helix domain-containing protein [Gemmatimonadaceae bacterium]|nr:helix-turn-helix domain-containing protein [Gemmatimonadaceae bacterium]
MISRSKLIEAAARVYAECGFRGATTRRIAEEAGVNEVTIFRNFGSKAALIHEAVRSHTGPSCPLPALPAEPADPEGELLAWASAYHGYLRDSAPLIRKTMGEIEERPEAVPCVSSGAIERSGTLRHYLRRVRRDGWLARGDDQQRRGGEAPLTPAQLDGAAAMLMGTLFADAMGRDMMPEIFPQPERSAVALYVRLFLRAIGFVPRPERQQQQQRHRAATTTSSTARARGEHGTTDDGAAAVSGAAPHSPSNRSTRHA